MWQLVTIAFFHSFLLLFGFHWPTPNDAMMLVGSGIANALAQYFWTQALRLAPTPAVSPFYYFLLVWALVIGFVVWGEVPTAGLIAGASIVVGSGLLLLWHETKASAVNLKFLSLSPQARLGTSNSHAAAVICRRGCDQSAIRSSTLSAGTAALNR